jgi:glycosyltransferase involved in cell wall biosynthesis
MKIVSYPKAKNTPYQELIYSQKIFHGDKITYLLSRKQYGLEVIFFIPALIHHRLLGYKVFHLHWIHTFKIYNRHWQNNFSLRLLYLHYLVCIFFIKFLGYKLVWTAHDIAQHSQVFLDDKKMVQKLAEACDAIIGHTQNTFKELTEISPYTGCAKIIIPHGNYLDVYPNTEKLNDARKKLNLQEKEFVFLFFGNIQKYKGIIPLLDAYKIISSEDNARLMIAGTLVEIELRNPVEELLVSNKIKFFPTRVEDRDIQIYFNASDIVVLPFKSITTSGSAILALSFGKAVIVPNIGDLMYLPDTVAYKYDAEDPEGLYKAMRRAIDNPEEVKEKSRNALIYAKNIPSWEEIAKETRGVFEGCINHTI